MALQITAWMVSGLWFSIYPIEVIRGEHLTRPAEALGLSGLAGLAPAAAIEQALDAHFGGRNWTLSAVQWMRRDGELYWRVAGASGEAPFTRLVGAEDARVLPMLSAAAAERAALSWLVEPAEAESVEWVGQGGDNSEIRGRSMPLWRVHFEQPEALSLYLDPWTAEIVARRTDRWRVFDFFWMLHIMDFENREDFNHPLLQVAAALGLVIALSGVLLWALTTGLLRRRQAGRL